MLFFLAYDNHVERDATMISASSETGTFTPANLKDRRLFRQWRAVGVTAFVDVDFGAVGRDIDFLGAVGPRFIDPDLRDVLQWFQPTDQVRHTLDDATFGVGAVYDSGWIAGDIHPDRGYHAHLLPVRKTAKKWRMEFNVASRAAVNFFDLSLLFASTIFAPTVNYGFGDALDTTDPSLITLAPTSGSRQAAKYDRILTFSAPFDWIPTDLDRDKWIAFNDHAGTTRPFFMGLNDTPPLGRKVMLAVQVKTSPVGEQSVFYSSRDFAAIEHR